MDGVRAEKGQLPLSASTDWQGFAQAVQGMIQVGGLPDVTPAEVTTSRTSYTSALAGLDRFKRILNIHVARWFTARPEPNRRRAPSLKELFDEILRSPDLFRWAHGDYAPMLQKAEKYRGLLSGSQKLAQHYSFFHWELEFPEVFYRVRLGTNRTIDRLGAAGFDAVVGNPPYFELPQLPPDVQTGIKALFSDAVVLKSNIYILFWWKSIDLLNSNGFCGFITSNKFLCTQNGGPLRSRILAKCKIHSAVDFGHQRVFGPTVETYSCILILQLSHQSGPSTIVIEQSGPGSGGGSDAEDDSNFTRFSMESSIFNRNRDHLFDISVSPIARPVLDFMESDPKFVSLCEIVRVRRGLASLGFRDLSLTSSKPRVPSVNANQVEAYGIVEPIFEVRKKVAISPFHREPKLLIKDICKQLTCARDEIGLACPSSLYYLFCKDRNLTAAILAYMNSSLASYYYANKYQNTQLTLGWLRVKGYYIEMLPVPQFTDDELRKLRELTETLEKSMRLLLCGVQMEGGRNTAYKFKRSFDLAEFSSVFKEVRYLHQEIDEAIFFAARLPAELRNTVRRDAGTRYLPYECILQGETRPHAEYSMAGAEDE